MLVYAGALLLSVIFAKFYKPDKLKSKRGINLIQLLLFLLACFPLWFITAFRYDVGTDYLFTYTKYFEHTKLGYTPYKSEPLFQLINTILVKLNLNIVWLFAICGAIIIIYTYKICFKYSENPVLSIVLFVFSSYFFASLSNVRQYVGLVLAVWGLLQNKSLKSVCYIIIGGLFHLSNFVFLIFYLILKVKLTKKRYLRLTFIGIILSPLLSYLLVKVLSFTKYRYFTFNLNGGFPLLFIFLNVFIYLLTVFYYNEKDGEFLKYAWLQMITVMLCIMSIFLNNEELLMRLMRITAFTQILLLPKIVGNEKNKSNRMFLIFLILCAYAVYTGYTCVWCGALEVFPYKFVFGVK